MSFWPPRTLHRGRYLHHRTLLTLAVATIVLGAGDAAWAQTSPASNTDLTNPTVPEPSAPPSGPAAEAAPPNGLAHDAGLYFTAPLHWNANDWAWFAGALAAIGASHHYDTQVYTHFTKGLTPSQIANINSNDLQDALPSVVVFLGTWGYAAWTSDPNGHREAWSMLEAAALSTVDAYALKFIVRREGPYNTSDPNEWFKSGGRSFPSEHATASFAIGTVLAEAGGDEYRWLRRVLGYGLGVGTSYLRLKHNAHWLSDTVAGGALGIASAQFTLNHAYRNQDAGFALVPVAGGAMLTYRMSLP
jgi:membrane-associated phospholipid phosphatase